MIWVEAGMLRLSVKPRTTYTLADSTTVIAAFRELSEARPMPLIIDVPGYPNADRDARKYWSSAEVRRLITSMAIVVHSPVMRVIGTFFIRLGKPPFPCKLFGDLEAAIAWTGRLGDR